MNKQLPNGQDLIDDAYTDAKYMAGRFTKLEDWKATRDYETARGRVEDLYGRGKDYDREALRGWKAGKSGHTPE